MILIVGGGIAGLGLATALSGRGIPCELVERDSSWKTVGAGITLYPNGLRALEMLGLADAVRQQGVAVETVRTLTAQGRLVAESPGESWPGIGSSVAIYRPRLQEILREAASEISVRMGVSPDRVSDQQEGSDGVLVDFSDGSSGRYEIIVGADGIHSSIRESCFAPASPSRYTGQTYWRGSITKTLVETSTLQMSENRYVALMPLGDDVFYVAAQLRTAEPPPPLPSSEWHARLMRDFGDFDGPAREAFALLGDDLHFGGGQEIDRAEWRRGRAVLIGDAAHACSPVLTQGGSLATEDAVVLAELLAGAGLADGRPAPSAIDAALAEFVRRREPRARWVRERTRRYIELMNSGAPAGDLTASLSDVSNYLRRPI